MHPTLRLLLAAAVPLALAKPQTTTADDSPENYVAEILDGFYGTNLPASATGAAATSLAAALYNYEVAELDGNDGYISAANDIYLVLATATNGDDIIATLDSQGFMNTELYTTSAWYSSSVPASAKSVWNSFIDELHVIETSALQAAATATATAVTWASLTGYGYDSSTGVSGVQRTTAATASATATAAAGTTAAPSGSAASGSSGAATTAAASASTSASTAGGATGARPTGAAVAGLVVVAAAAAALY